MKPKTSQRRASATMPVQLTPHMTVKELLDRYPQLLKTFLELDLLCVGCPAEAFHTVNDIATEYVYDPNELIQYFQRILDASEASVVPKP